MADTLQTNNSLNEPILNFDNISKKYCYGLRRSLYYGVKDIVKELLFFQNFSTKNKLRKGEFWALKNVSFNLHKGDALAIVGSNGAGKSTALKLLYGLIKPDAGVIHINGSVGAIIELGAGFDPILSGRENIYIRAALFGLTRKDTNKILEKITDFAEIEDFIDSPVKHYSSGMLARLSFSISAHLNPTILLVDEVLAVGDISFQRKCLNQMIKYLNEGGSLILVSHNPNLIQSTCKKGILLDKGKIIFEGNAVDTIDKHFDNEFTENQYETSLIKKQPTEKDPISIDKISLESLNNKEIYTGDEVRLRIEYSSYKAFKDAGWMFTIWSPDNLMCITGNATLKSISIKEGSGYLSCRIINMPLLAGKYVLKLSIFELSSLYPIVTYGWLESGFLFNVRTTPDIVTNAMRSVAQLFSIDTIWE